MTDAAEGGVVAELPAPAGRRPVVLLSRDEAYAVRELVTIAPLTTRTAAQAEERWRSTRRKKQSDAARVPDLIPTRFAPLRNLP